MPEDNPPELSEEIEEESPEKEKARIKEEARIKKKKEIDQIYESIKGPEREPLIIGLDRSLDKGIRELNSGGLRTKRDFEDWWRKHFKTRYCHRHRIRERIHSGFLDVNLVKHLDDLEETFEELGVKAQHITRDTKGDPRRVSVFGERDGEKFGLNLVSRRRFRIGRVVDMTGWYEGATGPENEALLEVYIRKLIAGIRRHSREIPNEEVKVTRRKCFRYHQFEETLGYGHVNIRISNCLRGLVETYDALSVEDFNIEKDTFGKTRGVRVSCEKDGEAFWFQSISSRKFRLPGDEKRRVVNLSGWYRGDHALGEEILFEIYTQLIRETRGYGKRSTVGTLRAMGDF